jgi:cyclin-dependent kinase 12/13
MRRVVAAQVDLIFRMCGTPCEEVWPGCGKLPWYHMFKPEKPHRRRLLEHLARAPADVQDLCDKLLTLDPAARLRADAALLHDYFFNDPQPCGPGSLPRYESSHEFQTKKRRQEVRAKSDADAAAKRAHTEAAVLAAGGMPLGGGGMRPPGAQPYHPHGHASGMHPYGNPLHVASGGGGAHTAAAPAPPTHAGAPSAGSYGGVYGGSVYAGGPRFAPGAAPAAGAVRPPEYRPGLPGAQGRVPGSAATDGARPPPAGARPPQPPPGGGRPH